MKRGEGCRKEHQDLRQGWRCAFTAVVVHLWRVALRCQPLIRETQGQGMGHRRETGEGVACLGLGWVHAQWMGGVWLPGGWRARGTGWVHECSLQVAKEALHPFRNRLTGRWCYHLSRTVPSFHPRHRELKSKTGHKAAYQPKIRGD